MKEFIQVTSIPLICRNCEKYIGDICKEFTDPIEGCKKAQEILDYLRQTDTFPMCDVCSAQGNKMGLTMGRK